jgi:hypothetical protein
MRTLGDTRRKAPVEAPKQEAPATANKEAAEAPAETPASFDESVVIS